MDGGPESRKGGRKGAWGARGHLKKKPSAKRGYPLRQGKALGAVRLHGWPPRAVGGLPVGGQVEAGTSSLSRERRKRRKGERNTEQKNVCILAAQPLPHETFNFECKMEDKVKWRTTNEERCGKGDYSGLRTTARYPKYTVARRTIFKFQFSIFLMAKVSFPPLCCHILRTLIYFPLRRTHKLPLIGYGEKPWTPGW